MMSWQVSEEIFRGKGACTRREGRGRTLSQQICGGSPAIESVALLPPRGPLIENIADDVNAMLCVTKFSTIFLCLANLLVT